MNSVEPLLDGSGTHADPVGESLSVSLTRDTLGVITSVEDTMAELLGWKPQDLIGQSSTEFIHPEDQPGAVLAWLEMINDPGATRVWRGRYRDAGGAWHWVESVNVNRLDDPDRPVVQSSMTLVTVHEAGIEEELRARRQLISRLSDALPLGLFQIDSRGHIKFTNDRLHSILECPPSATVEAQFGTVVPDDQPRLMAALAAVLADLPVDDIELRVRPVGADPTDAAAGGSERTCLLGLRALTDSTGNVSGAIGCLSDVTDSVQLRQELERRASVDDLTSCLTRSAALELLEATLRGAAEGGRGTAAVFIDLDRFKPVNDVLGHAAGDRLLAIAAERLRGAVRVDDRVGRVGGDEFLVICPDIGGPQEALRLAQRLSVALQAEVDVGPGRVQLQASVGVAWTRGILEPDALVAQADHAMYESKRVYDALPRLFGVDVTAPAFDRRRTSKAS